MAPSTQSEGLLALGKKLVNELGLGDPADTLARWMAHALAEKLQAIDAAELVDRPAAEAEAIELILKIWERRRTLPPLYRPFEDVETLARVLRQLDPEDRASRFYDPASVAQIDKAPPEAQQWLKRALAIDSAARSAITHCLLAADAATEGKRAEWAEAAEAAGLERDIEVVIVRYVGKLQAGRRAEALNDTAIRHLRHAEEKAAILKAAAAEVEADIARLLGAKKRLSKRGRSA
jgi:hypothetical protein